MKFNFKIQQYQTDAVDSITAVFEGQPNFTLSKYRRDMGKVETDKSQPGLWNDEPDDVGFKNEGITLSDGQLLDNIQKIQQKNNIIQSGDLIHDKGRVSLDIEMETGTGKTYCYTKMMFELNKKYGWSKFIVVVPSIAIREGVAKSFEYTTDHFMEQYGKKARVFIYSSKNLNELDNFSSSAEIQVMIINTQAFARSFEEVKDGKKGNAQQLIIYSKRDEFQSRRPIDVIKANNPIIILDEPQKMGGFATQKALLNFNPLFTVNFSATHAKHHNLVYALDAVDAYNQKLVKKIQVKSVEVKNILGTNQYIYLDSIVLSKEAPKARLEIEIGQKGSVSRKTLLISHEDNLFYKSNELNEYKNGFVVTDIKPGNEFETGSVTFSNGVVLHTGEIYGDVNEDDIRRAQIRETIKSHFAKEAELYNKGIKTLSLFFIDEVAKYRQYDDDGNQINGIYGKIFEEEYKEQLAIITQDLFDSPYLQYLRSIKPEDTHQGYFSIDKRGRMVNNIGEDGKEKALKEGSSSDDISAYERIIKRKDLLLSLDDPVRFIFSHSALREGWDNPNVFQICTLKHSDSTTTKRQEVGRGMRLAVDQNGIRQDKMELGESGVHKLNVLTVIANESYANFTKSLQEEIKENLYERPKAATIKFFVGKILTDEKGNELKVDDKAANKIHNFLIRNGYIDDDDKVTPLFKEAVKNQVYGTLSEDLQPYILSVVKYVRSIYDDSIVDTMIGNGNSTSVPKLELNKNFNKAEFQELWKKINHKYAYKVSVDTESLIKDSKNRINSQLTVSELSYIVETGTQEEKIEKEDIEAGTSFKDEKAKTEKLRTGGVTSLTYDIIGEIAKRAKLTRKTVASILTEINYDKFLMYHKNPEQFIRKVSDLILETKVDTVIDHITYEKIDGEYDSDIFTSNSNINLEKAFKSEKCINDYVVFDSTIEKDFAMELEKHTEVCVYAKLPRSFQIPTPVGDYAPDWAIAFNKGTVKHIYFIAETKGAEMEQDRKGVENAKIACASKLFNMISTEGVKYHSVTSYDSLLAAMDAV